MTETVLGVPSYPNGTKYASAWFFDHENRKLQKTTKFCASTEKESEFSSEGGMRETGLAFLN